MVFKHLSIGDKCYSAKEIMFNVGEYREDDGF